MATEYLNNKTFETLIVKFQSAKKEHTKYRMFIEDIRGTEARTFRRGKYQKPSSWDETEVNYQTVNLTYQETQQELAFAFYKLSENIVRYARFNLIDQDDAVQEGVMICFEKIDRFDPEKGKAFNYMTTCILNHFRQLYRTARNYNELKRKYLDFVMIQLDRHTTNPSKKGLYKKQGADA